ncbi:MAG: 1-(5-phosphoribosyl)-5-[(5-phosphoribosylamino)methylideneamino]imidazole-4-carboxamide isomerase [Planctomycetaceae bacterium]|nr:1-(5-phosphoribosyl)-5-[(5-phosphoribosylamino)methylideneamino]imidazole-4-carboxamide isomerase [Planctomycetaceae bacterium]
MEIWPAIDIRGGKCVRLRQGDYSQETVFADNPLEMAKIWVSQGAKRLHLVDLDGAKTGDSVNFSVISRLAEVSGVLCEVGGGIRSEEMIRKYLDAGLHRLVLGTLAIKQPEWFKEMCYKFPQKLVLGLDAKNGFVATDGWLETSPSTAIALAKQFEAFPIAAIVYTDIATDGMMQGPNIAAMKEMRENVRTEIVASGGVTTMNDVKNLKQAGLHGCIIGRALYEKTVSLAEAVAIAEWKHEHNEQRAE